MRKIKANVVSNKALSRLSQSLESTGDNFPLIKNYDSTQKAQKNDFYDRHNDDYMFNRDRNKSGIRSVISKKKFIPNIKLNPLSRSALMDDRKKPAIIE